MYNKNILVFEWRKTTFRTDSKVMLRVGDVSLIIKQMTALPRLFSKEERK
jgi:hypothetical protein